MDKKNECQVCGKPINLEEFDETREIPQLMARTAAALLIVARVGGKRCM